MQVSLFRPLKNQTTFLVGFFDIDSFDTHQFFPFLLLYAALIYQIDDDVATTPYDTPVTMTTILDNDVSTSPLTFDSITNGTNGTCTLLGDGSTVVYSPEPGFTGIDVCLYTVCDVNQLCDEAVSSLALWL